MMRLKITYLSFPCLSVHPNLICQPKAPRVLLDMRKMQSCRWMYLYIFYIFEGPDIMWNTESIVLYYGQPLPVRN